MIRSLMPRLVPALAVAVLAAPAAFAQPMPPGHEGMNPEQMMARMKARHEAMEKQRLEDLRTVLRLRPDQEPALAAFVAAHRPPPGGPMGGPMAGMMGHGDGDDALTTPQRLERQAKREAAMDAQRAKRREALTKFYAALSPDQQKVFDALQRLQRPRGPGGPGAHMMHMKGGEGGGPRVIVRRLQGGPDAPPPPPGR